MNENSIALVIRVDAEIEIDATDRSQCGFGCHHSTRGAWCELFNSPTNCGSSRRIRCERCAEKTGDKP